MTGDTLDRPQASGCGFVMARSKRTTGLNDDVEKCRVWAWWNVAPTNEKPANTHRAKVRLALSDPVSLW